MTKSSNKKDKLIPSENCKNCKILDIEIKRLTKELAYVQSMPELEWVQVTTTLMQIFAVLSKLDETNLAKKMVEVLDRGSCYVSRLKARNEKTDDLINKLIVNRDIY